MPSRIVLAVPGPTPATFTFTVPGNERWVVRAVCATAQRAVGGLPTRGYTLTMGASGFTLGTVGAPDEGTEPGTCIVTFSDAPASAVALGPLGYVVAPFAAVPIDPGYVLTGAIVNPAAGDAFVNPVAWIDYTPA